MTTVTLRPNSTIASAGTSTTGAASGHAALSDNVDTSYISNFTTANAEYGADTFTLPAGAVVKQIRARVRAKDSTGWWVEWSLQRDADQPLGLGFVYTTSTFTEYIGGWSTGPAISALTQAQIDAAFFRVRGASTGAVQVSELYADLQYVAIPVVAVTAVTPDPYTASNTVPIAWSNTLDADGGGQVRYWVKAFTAAQYGASGFNPETSSASYDSGNTLSSASTTSVGPLSNGVTYRAYVKVAQTVNSVSHWSAWGFDEFTIDISTADVDAVTTIVDDATAKITVTVDRDVASELWGSIEVQRSVDGGSTWNYVRGARNVADATDQFIVADYEVGNGESVTYRARATRVVSGLTITGEWVSSTSTSWSSTSTWLKDPDLPDRNLRVRFAVVPQLTRPRPQVAHRVLNSPTSIVVSDVLGGRSGTLILLTTTLEEAAAFETLVENATLLLQTPPTHGIGSVYFTCGDVTPERLTRLITDPHRHWVIPVVETIAPADPNAVI